MMVCYEEVLQYFTSVHRMKILKGKKQNTKTLYLLQELKGLVIAKILLMKYHV